MEWTGKRHWETGRLYQTRHGTLECNEPLVMNM